MIGERHVFAYKSISSHLRVLLVSCGSEDAPTQEASPQVAAVSRQSAGSDGELENAGPELGSFGVDLSHQDPTFAPGMTFSATPMANGWKALSCRPAAATTGRLRYSVDRSDQRVRTIIDDLSSREPAMGTIEQKISDYYKSYMDVETLNELGSVPCCRV